MKLMCSIEQKHTLLTLSGSTYEANYNVVPADGITLKQMFYNII